MYSRRQCDIKKTFKEQNVDEKNQAEKQTVSIMLNLVFLVANKWFIFQKFQPPRREKKKTANMLITLVVVFFISNFPVHSLNILV